MNQKTISLEQFMNLSYNPKNISNYRLIDCKCVRCGCNFEYQAVKKFMLNRKKYPYKKNKWNTCQKCWLIIQTSENPEWIEKNKQAQLIAQNKPEQKKKNAEAVSKSWDKERKEKFSKLLKDRWKNDSEFAKNALKNISWTTKKDDRYLTIMSKSLGSGGLQGVYNNIFYQSALELSYILWCEENNIKIKRYDMDPIEYFDENNIKRLYYPDFIINSDTIVEIKGFGLYYNKNYERNIKKLQALKSITSKYEIYIDTDKQVKTHYRKARKIHHEIKKQKNH